MKIKNISLYPLSLLVSLVVIYLIANDQHGWYIYLLIGFLIVERAFLQLALKLVASVQKKIAEALAANLSQMMNERAVPPKGLDIDG